MQKILDVKTVSLTIKLKILMLIVKKIRSFTPKDPIFCMLPFRVFKFTSSFTTIISFILDFYSSIGLLYSKIPTDENQINRSFSSVGKMLNSEDNSSYQIIPYILTFITYIR